MSKIVQAVNSMIANPKLISSVLKGESEIFFLYKGKFKWSIGRRDDGCHLWFYACDISIQNLANMEGNDWSFTDMQMVHYHDAEIGTKEARASFSELYTLVTEKVYGIDSVLDEIIADDLLPF